MPVISPYAGHRSLVALGKAIRASRLSRQISQEELAHLSKIDRAHMSSIERGTQNPGFVSVYRIARALKMTVTDLMAEADL